ncbi:phosphoglycerate mutase-like protein [Aaosphaeria arxii CBS 175.79]|uniref:Phosphoglycerate mutase-like protein n=1 Tax=Aaosphaeria arxii CBS 175.79 TaxID=1450172 RepID=A0A6A5XVQ4_9PLEO|nr:phosphoglycerate mutase-like protein [Aaosphaeria arxii CBS 175.79]KAF2016907.1 phosphoglycerate mutase-like protein [Aaosphaeria arxii CBS 175.79]
MVRKVRLFLIRHGETVDNVAQVYAGSRDSALTNHGFHQATRLGLHFEALGLRFTHFFSSHLQRAAKTASLIRQAQLTTSDASDVSKIPEVTQVPALMEQDFGFYEGKKFFERQEPTRTTGKDAHRQSHKDQAGFVDVESKDSLAKRADAFLDAHLLPIFDDAVEPGDCVVAIVSHGIMLSTLWKRILLRLPPQSVTLSPEVVVKSPRFSLEHLGGWSNTGYLDLHMSKDTKDSDPTPSVVKRSVLRSSQSQSIDCSNEEQKPIDTNAIEKQPNQAQTPSGPLSSGWVTLVQAIDAKDHLGGLKRTRGGIGSAKHDTSQKKLDGFFKRRKAE